MVIGGWDGGVLSCVRFGGEEIVVEIGLDVRLVVETCLSGMELPMVRL